MLCLIIFPKINSYPDTFFYLTYITSQKVLLLDNIKVYSKAAFSIFESRTAHIVKFVPANPCNNTNSYAALPFFQCCITICSNKHQFLGFCAFNLLILVFGKSRETPSHTKGKGKGEDLKVELGTSDQLANVPIFTRLAKLGLWNGFCTSAAFDVDLFD